MIDKESLPYIYIAVVFKSDQIGSYDLLIACPNDLLDGLIKYEERQTEDHKKTNNKLGSDRPDHLLFRLLLELIPDAEYGCDQIAGIQFFAKPLNMRIHRPRVPHEIITPD